MKRRYVSAVLQSLFAMLAFSAQAANFTPPTHYVADPFVFNIPQFIGHTPDEIAQAVVSYWNAKGGDQMKNLQSCAFSYSITGHWSYACPYDMCGTSCLHKDIGIEVWPHCGQYGASWNGAEFICPETPQPGCDDSCK